MSMIKKTTLTIKNNTNVRLSNQLKFYKNDSVTIYFEIEEYNFELKNYSKMSPLSAIAFIETPDGKDTVNTTITDGNLICFNLTSRYTKDVGIFKMQLVVRDKDGCQSAIPSFEFEVRDLINDAVLLVDGNGNVIVTDDGEPLVAFGESFYRITDLNEVENISDEAYIMITQDGTSYKAKLNSIGGGSSVDVDLSNYYNKEEVLGMVNSLSSRIEAKVDSTYVRQEIDKALNNINLSEYYTKDEMDASLSLKSDVSHTHTSNEITDLTIPNKLSDLENDSGFLTEIPLEYVTDEELESKGYLTEHQDISNLALKSELHSHVNMAVLSTITNYKVNQWNNKSDFSGSYNDLTNKPVIPTRTSQLTNNSGFITTIPDEYITDDELNAKGYATETFVTNKIAEASLGGSGVDLSDYALKTELHSHNNKDVLDTITSNKINEWDNKSDFSGSYDDLTNKPTIPIVTNDLTDTLKSNYDTAYTHSQSQHAPVNAQPNSEITKEEIEAKLTGDIATHTHSQYLTEHQSLEDYATKTYVNDAINNASIGGDVNLDGYAKLTDIPTLTSQLTNDSGFLTEIPSEYITDTELNSKGYLTEHQDISHLASKSELHNHTNKNVLDGITSDKVNSWDNKSNFSGNYNDLTNKPTIPQQYVLPEASSTTLGGVKVGSGLSISNGVLSATGGGGVADSVDWSNVQNKPTIPSKTSELTNDSGFITSVPEEYVTETELDAKGYLTQHQDLSSYALKTELHSHTNKSTLDGITDAKINSWDNKSDFSGNYNDLTNKPTIPSAYTHPSTHPATMITGLSTVATSGSYNDLNNKPIIPTKMSQLTNDNEYATMDDIRMFATDLEVLASNMHNHSNKVTLDGITDEKVAEWNNKSNFSGSYNDLTNKPTIPSKTSQLTNDSGFLTSVPSEYVTETELNAKGYATTSQIPTSLPANGGDANTVGGYTIWVGTQAQYNAIASKSSTTIYMIKG